MSEVGWWGGSLGERGGGGGGRPGTGREGGFNTLLRSEEPTYSRAARRPRKKHSNMEMDGCLASTQENKINTAHVIRNPLSLSHTRRM